jgi:4-carboxymuconolactone decarboxylase
MSSRLRIDELRQRLAQVPPESRTREDRDTAYRELIGIVPPLLREPGKESLAAALRGLHDQMLATGTIPQATGARATHLTLLAMMLMGQGAGALAQAVAARRAGASWDDLHHMVNLAFLLFGLPGADRGQELVAALAEWEQQDRIEGAVAAYG